MSAPHPILPIAALDRRHPGLTPAIAAVHTEVPPSASAVIMTTHRRAIKHPMTNRLPFSGRHVHEVSLEENRPKPEWRGEMRSASGRDLLNFVVRSQPGEFRSATNSAFLERAIE